MPALPKSGMTDTHTGQCVSHIHSTVGLHPTDTEVDKAACMPQGHACCVRQRCTVMHKSTCRLRADAMQALLAKYDCNAVLQCSSAMQFCNAVLQCCTAISCCSALFARKCLTRDCKVVLQFASLQCCFAMAYSNALLQYMLIALLQR